MMTTTEFFADFHYDQYSEFVEAELREMFLDTTPQDEKFDLDVPFWSRYNIYLNSAETN